MPLLFQNYFCNKKEISGKLFTRKGWKSLILGPTVSWSSTATSIWSGSSPSFPLFLTHTSPPPSPVVLSSSFHQLCCSFDLPGSWFNSLKLSRKQTNKRNNSSFLDLFAAFWDRELNQLTERSNEHQGSSKRSHAPAHSLSGSCSISFLHLKFHL